MNSRMLWNLIKISRRLGMRAAVFSALGVLTALAGVLLDDVVPASLASNIGVDAVDSLLGILSTSMLSVTIFSLSTMVAAYSAATSTVTPRATKLLVEDSVAQNALSTFVGSFLFSLVGLVALKSGLYAGQGRVALYLVTLVVMVIVVVTLLRWIEHVSQLGRVGQTTDRVEQAASKALCEWRDNPFLGGVQGEREQPPGSHSVYSQRFGYVQHIDMERLDDFSREHTRPVHIAALPGTYADRAHPLLYVAGELDENMRERLRAAFTVADERSFDQDPRFGAAVLAEIASRALSPGVNDGGTAIDVIGRGVRLFAALADASNAANSDNAEVRFPYVHVPLMEIDALFDDLFAPIGRDAAGLLEVGIRLQKGLHTLALVDRQRFHQPARRHSALALARAEAALVLDQDKERLRELAKQIDSL